MDLQQGMLENLGKLSFFVAVSHWSLLIGASSWCIAAELLAHKYERLH
jgi:hypothetical protein